MTVASYATVEQVIKRYGDDLLHIIADRDRDGEIDQEAVTLALADASGQIDSALAKRYPLPLPIQSRPALLTRLCVDIAVYWLAEDGAGATDDKRRRYEDAMKYLERLADGRIDLPSVSDGIEPPGSGVGSGDSMVGAEFSASERLFTRQTMRGF